MAVYTDVAADELAEFLGHYDIGELLSYKGIAEGVENSNFLLHASSGYFILTLYEKRVAKKDLPFFLGLMTHLASNGINCPQPVKNKRGEALSTLAGRPAVIITFLEGSWPRKPTAVHCAGVGQALAKMHLAAGNFDNARENTLSPGYFDGLFEPAASRADEVQPGLRAFIAKELAYLDNSGWPFKLPVGIIHADLFPDNVFFLDDQVSGIIDFTFACTYYLAYDIAICLNAWCFESDCSFNVTKAQAFLYAYHSERALTFNELADLPLLARGAAMRFLLTRLVDFLNVPEGALVRPKDPLEYARKLRFQQGAKSIRDWGIDVSRLNA
jgi:homoserine kinase type II